MKLSFPILLIFIIVSFQLNAQLAVRFESKIEGSAISSPVLFVIPQTKYLSEKDLYMEESFFWRKK